MVVWSWTLDVSALVVIVAASAVYLRCYMRISASGTVSRGQAACFFSGMVVWALSTFSAVGVYAPALFWVRSLQVLLLLFVTPFLLALGRPLTVLGVPESILDRRIVRAVCSPLATSAAMLATPWLLFLTPWYVASMTGPLAVATRLLLVLVGFGYFYARLQSDPVPQRFSPMVSIGISVVESLADGVLGVVLWLGPLIAADYYATARPDWGPSPRVDQSVGAGILWIVADVLSIPFVLVLMRRLGTHERRRAAQVDAELDAELDEAVEQSPTTALWWENDPQLRDRFGKA